jgi:dienelactone hydrolase
MHLKLAVLMALLVLAGCARVDISPQIRWQHADQLAADSSWQKIYLPAGGFVLAAFIPRELQQSDTLTIYIEGDGFAWVNSSTPSFDPTPINPLALQLALHHPRGNAVYLARPCQYVGGVNRRNCTMTYWTNRRFAPEVVEASNQAIAQLKQQFKATHIELIGFSGGGAVAALVATRRMDVTRLITVAGNLDPDAWTKIHHASPLMGSLNPANEWQSLWAVPQLHFIGGQDRNIPAAVAQSYRARFPENHRPQLRVVDGFDHHCCWVEQWPALLNEALP